MKRFWQWIKNRRFIQVFATVLSNPILQNFPKGTIYQGSGKHFCVPGLNCYSCPAAAGSCPIGALQAVLGDRNFSFSYYVIGILAFFGVLFGRLICGFLCPFGFFQDLLHKIPTPKLHIAKRIDRPLRYLKYLILAVFVVLLPLFLTDAFGSATPYFCKLICPAGTLEGGIPLLIENESLRLMAGFLFDWKIFLLLVTVIGSVFLYRPFCKYLCPLGAFYALFNRISFYRLKVDEVKCTGCKVCEKKCKMNVELTKNINSAECIRCGDCISVCPEAAITSNLHLKGEQTAINLSDKA